MTIEYSSRTFYSPVYDLIDEIKPQPSILGIALVIALLILIIVGGITLRYMRYKWNRQKHERRSLELDTAFGRGGETAHLIASDSED